MYRKDSEFLDFLGEWVESLKPVKVEKIFHQPENVAIISVDVINGFCKFGPLSSPRVNSIVAPIVALFMRAWQAGCRNIVLTQDTHEPDAVEFGAYPPHCVRGTEEAETVSEIKGLPFFDHITVLEKNSIDSGLDSGLDTWIAAYPRVHTFIVVGDCTDLCTYQLAMHLRLSANERQKDWRVIVPEDCTDTYDTSIKAAQEINAFPHPADFFHHTFLYHMALNGIEVVKEVN